jgi:ribose transport system permease protein
VSGVAAFVSRHRYIVLSYVNALVLLAIVSVLKPGFGFGSRASLSSLAVEGSVIALVALSQTVVIITGGIDLSLPWIITGGALLTCTLAHQHDSALWWTIPVVLACAAGVGLVNGVGVAVFAVNPVIMTLAMNAILLGAVSGISVASAGVIFNTPPPAIEHLASNATLGIPNVVLLVLALAGAISVVLSYSAFGRRLYAVGSNGRVAQYSGVNVSATIIAAYVLSAVAAATSGIVLAGKFGQAYLGMGDQYLFVSISAVILGGASIFGGAGHYLGTIGGALLVAVLTATVAVFDLSRSYQLMLYGVVVLLAVLVAGGEQEDEGQVSVLSRLRRVKTVE